MDENSIYKDSLLGSGYIQWIDYGVVHECYDFNLDYPSDLLGDYWVPYTSIDIGIHRLNPSEAQVKSDLQFYNEDRIQWGHGHVYDILAYNMVTHGGPHWEVWGWVQIWWWWEYRYLGTIYPNEISVLWYHSYDPYLDLEIDVYPWYTILISDSCYGYFKPPSTDPTMAKAFVDYHASAFVGATILVPTDSNAFMRAFWNDLCQGNYNVRHATISLCDTYVNNWNLGDEWRIYGNQYKTLP